MVANFVERRTKTPYEDLMRRLLFQPLGMTHAGFGCMASEGKIDGPWGHVREGNQIKPIPPDRHQASQPRAPWVATCTVPSSTWHDSLRSTLKAVAEPAGSSVPKRSKRCKRLSPAVISRPGWATEHHEWSKGIVLAHNGSIGQNYAVCRLSPSEGLGVCAMTNIGGDEGSHAWESVTSWLIMGIKRGWVTTADRRMARSIPPRPDVPLETLQPVRATTGFGHVRTGKTAADTPLRLDGHDLRQRCRRACQLGTRLLRGSHI